MNTIPTLPVYEFTYTRDQVIALARNYKSNSFSKGHVLSKALHGVLNYNPTSRDMIAWLELLEAIHLISNGETDIFIHPQVVEWMSEGLGIKDDGSK